MERPFELPPQRKILSYEDYLKTNNVFDKNTAIDTLKKHGFIEGKDFDNIDYTEVKQEPIDLS